VWAIGTGKNADPEHAYTIMRRIRKIVGEMIGAGAARKVRILYGGSVKSDNAAQLFSQTDIDGGLIGGASLKAADFIAICRAAG